jgi:energy-coupling factor transporter ATP-binding protein EcfA2
METLKLHVEGFDSPKSVDWSPGDLNAVIGPNGSGKSNLLRVLELLSASARRELAESIQSAGRIRPLLWDGQADAIDCTTPIEAELEVLRYALAYRVKVMSIGKASAYRLQSEMLFNDYLVRTGRQKEPFKFLEREKIAGGQRPSRVGQGPVCSNPGPRNHLQRGSRSYEPGSDYSIVRRNAKTCNYLQLRTECRFSVVRRKSLRCKGMKQTSKLGTGCIE